MSQIKSPFKFLDSYQKSDAEVFFGRKKETDYLYDALSGVKLLLVYGPSGAGKTILIECGLRNQFSDADWYAITIRKGADINASVFAGINNALNEKVEIDPDTKMPLNPLTEFGQVVEQLFAERYQPVYLLFDQFEELLISGVEEEKKKFFILLNKLIRNKVPCRILLIMREEFIGHLSEFEPLCPTIFQHRYRVEKMGRKNVEGVIYNILEAQKYKPYFKVKDSQKLVETILSILPDNRNEIELAHVQVFLEELWDRAQKNKNNNDLPVLRVALIEDKDKLEGILESFLKKQIKELEEGYGERVPLELLAAMISERFTKLQLSEDAIEADLEGKKVVSKKPIAYLLKELELRRIVRTIKIGDETQYEISHDVLALVVGQNLTEEMKMREKAIDIYKVYQERKGLFTQDDIDYLRPFQQNLAYPQELQVRIDESISAIEKNRNEELAKTKKRLQTLYSILGVALLALTAVGYFWLNANAQKRLAQQETIKSQTLTLTTLAGEQIDKNPTLSIRLAELAWKNSPTLHTQRTLINVFYKSMEFKKLFYANNLVHSNSVYNAVFSLDGKKIVTASKDSTAKIWDAESGMLIQTLIGHEGRINSAVFSPASPIDPDGGKKIVTASNDSTAKIWETESGRLIQSFGGHEGEVRSAVFSPDGKKIMTISRDNTAKMWDVETGRVIHTFIEHMTPIYFAVFSPNGKKIVTNSINKTAKIWDAESMKEIHTLAGHESDFYRAVFSPNGNKIVTTARDYTAIIWDAKSGKKIHTLKVQDDYLDGAVFSPDGNKIVTISRTAAKIWDVESGTVIHTLAGHGKNVFSAIFSPDGKNIVTASSDKTAKIWDAESGTEIYTLTGHEDYVYNAVFSPACDDDPVGGKIIVTISSDNSAKIWNIESGRVIQKFPGYYKNVFHGPFSPDGTKIVTVCTDSTAKMWDIESGRVIHTFSREDDVDIAVFSPACIDDPVGGIKILTVSRDTTAKIWDAVSYQVIHTLTGHKASVLSAIFSPDGKKILTASKDSTAKIWDAESGREIYTLRGHVGQVSEAEFSPDGKKIVTASRDNTAKIWDAESGKEIHPLTGHHLYVYNALFSPDGKKIVTASYDNTVKIWDAESVKEIHTLAGHGHIISSVVLSPASPNDPVGGKRIVTASHDQTAKIWDAESGKEIHTLKGHEGVVYSAIFSPDGKMIVTASFDKTLKIWDAESGKLKYTFTGQESGFFFAVFSPDGKKILTVSVDKITRMWLTPEGIIDWLGTSNIYSLSQKDLENLGIDFIDLKYSKK